MISVNQSNLCPVCGYHLGFEPWNGNSASHEMCPSCGIEFGYDDVPEASGAKGTRKQIYARWRKEWMKEGMKWASEGIKPPAHWDPTKQMDRIRIRPSSRG